MAGLEDKTYDANVALSWARNDDPRAFDNNNNYVFFFIEKYASDGPGFGCDY